MQKRWLGMFVLGLVVNVQAEWALLDDFDSYDNTSSTSTTTASGGAWTSVFDGTANSLIVDSEKGQSLKSLGGAAWRGAERDLTGTDAAVLVDEVQTFFWQVKVSHTAAGSHDFMMGLSPSVANIDETDAWQDFSVMPYVNNNVTTPYINAQGVEPYWAPMSPDTWYNVWIVVDNDASAPTYDLYYSTGNDDGVLVEADADWRNFSANQVLNAIGFMAAGSAGSEQYIDNIYYTAGEDISNPLAGLYFAAVLDDFSGDLGGYVGTRILDANGGAHNTAAWEISDGALQFNTTVYDGIEQHALILTDLALGVDEELQADFSVYGNQDLGLYVGGTTPVVDSRADYVAVYVRGDGSVLSRGFDGGGEFGLVSGGAPVIDKLFIKRTAENTYETGYYTGDTRTILATRTPATPNDGDVVGFYADVRAAGILGTADNLRIVSNSTDNDADTLPDGFEQLIVDDNPGDGIAAIADVLPGDDYDNDGFTNQQEFDLDLNPIAADDAGTDTDGDYLPDLWEFAGLGELGFNSYDDNDSDGYNNQAERIAGTDPMLDSDSPDFAAPSVAFIRDSVVASNACLMPSGAPYGNAIIGISYQEQILHTFDGYQYTAWYDTVGSVQKVCLARRTVSETAVGEWETVQTDSEFSNGDETGANGAYNWDAHNVISFGISAADGTLHIAWDHHNNTLRYRKSVPGLCTTNKGAWGAGMLNAEQNWLVDSGTPEYDVTYPQFLATPGGGLVMNRRIGISGNGDQLFQMYDPSTGAWNAHVEFISRDGSYTGPNPAGSTVTATERCAYLNGLDIDIGGVTHVTWTWRESASQHGNRDICYATSPDRGTNWYNSAGVHLADTSVGEHITARSPGVTVVPLNMRQLMINQQTQCVDNDGRVHVLMQHRRQDPGHEPGVYSRIFSTLHSAYYHYFRDPQTGEWTQRRIPPDAYPVGSRPRIGYDADGNVYAAYLSYPAGTDVFPGYRENDDVSVLVIAGASKASSYTDWQVMQVIDGDFDGEPLFDQNRLLEDDILAVYIQEHRSYTSSTAGIPAPLHVYEFAVNVPAPESLSLINYDALGDDVLITAYGQLGSSYQLQATDDLTAGWGNIGANADGMNSLLALPDADGLQNARRFYRVISN